MGQIERYGLFVLSLVIFFILGIAIWGPTDTSASGGAEGEGLSQGKAGAALETRQNNLDEVEDFLSQRRESARQRQRQAEERKEVPNEEDIFGAAMGANQPGNRPADKPADKPVPPGPVEQPKTQPAEKPVPQFEMYRIRKGDTLGHIAQRKLGSSRRYKLLEKHNPRYRTKPLVPGEVLKIPRDLILKHGGTVASGRKHTVKKGENLWTIAKKYFGARQATAYTKKIKALNNMSTDRVDAGMVLAMPAAR